VLPTVKAVVGVMVFTDSVPPTLTVDPFSVIMESAIALLLVNMANVFVVPPGDVTPPPIPTQFPAVVHML